MGFSPVCLITKCMLETIMLPAQLLPGVDYDLGLQMATLLFFFMSIHPLCCHPTVPFRTWLSKLAQV